MLLGNHETEVEECHPSKGALCSWTQSFLPKLPSCSFLSVKCPGVVRRDARLPPRPAADSKEHPFLHPSSLEPCLCFLCMRREPASFFSTEQLVSSMFSVSSGRQTIERPALQPGSLDDSCLQGCSTVTNSSVLHSNCAPPLMLK